MPCLSELPVRHRNLLLDAVANGTATFRAEPAVAMIDPPPVRAVMQQA